jgi:hypothetical protein
MRVDGPTWRRRRGGETAVDLTELEAELVLLREQNASLRVDHARDGSISRALERARLLQDEGQAAPDDGAQTLAQALAVRESVLNLCREFEGALTAIRSRLDDPADAASRLQTGSGQTGGWSVEALRRLVEDEAASIDPEWVEELRTYLHYLAAFAQDGIVPARFDALIGSVFGQLIELRQASAAA